MGGGSWSSSDWDGYAAKTKSKPAAAIFKSSRIKANLDPNGVKLRESRDSKEHPNSTAIIVALDVTGSMGMIAESLAKQGLGTLFQEILDRKPVTDPQLMFMAVGDCAMYDTAPLQVSQFESSNVIIDQLTDIFVEGGGGGNQSESYQLPWYFAATKTSIDCFEKRGKKGYLFTIGDEMTPPELTPDQIQKVLGESISQSISSEEAYKMASRMYHVFHLIVDEGSFASSALKQVDSAWKNLMGQHAMHLTDYKKLSEVIVSTIQVIEGENADKVVKSWKGGTAIAVASAIKDLVPLKGGGKREVVRL